jgi:hypothetical protein
MYTEEHELKLKKRQFLVIQEELESKLALREKKLKSTVVIHNSYVAQVNRLSLKLEMDKLDENEREFEKNFMMTQL